VSISWQKVKTIVYSAKVGNYTATRSDLFKLIDDIANYRPIDNSGAKWDYGVGMYNGD